MNFKEAVKRYILSYDMIGKGDRIIAGISGGADSVCLFLLLTELREEIGFSFSVIHVEHGIRGAESERDAEFVEKLCNQNGIPCSVVHVDAPGYAETEKLTLEEAARDLRYRELFVALRSEKEKTAEASGRVRVAVAHHQEDQAETMLFHLIRGSSLRGLGAMKPVQNDLIRPLLNFSRGEIIQYLAEKGQLFQKDETNDDLRYTRNRIREKVIPELTCLNTNAVSHISASARELREVSEYLDLEINYAYERLVIPGEKPVIKKEGFLELPALIQRGVLFEALSRVCGSRKDITRTHVEELRELMEKQSGRRLSLPYSVNAQRIYQGIRLVCRPRGVEKETEGKTEEELRRLVKTRIFEAPKELLIPKKKYTKWFDYDKIKYRPLVRTRHSGDYLMTAPCEKKLLKKYYIDEKIPGEERSGIPLLCDGNHVIWVIGYRISDHYKVGKNTKRILEAMYLRGAEE